jgi:hypothetical protein
MSMGVASQVRDTTALAVCIASWLRDEGATCPLRARWIGRTQGFTVTDGAAGRSADLQEHWSCLPAALIPKLIVDTCQPPQEPLVMLVTKECAQAGQPSRHLSSIVEVEAPIGIQLRVADRERST